MNVYGPLIEHNEYPLTDERHFTVTILPHIYGEGDDIRRDACNECAYPEDMPFHCHCKNHPYFDLDVHYTDCPMYKD